jgi:hypothetical protein
MEFFSLIRSCKLILQQIREKGRKRLKQNNDRKKLSSNLLVMLFLIVLLVAAESVSVTSNDRTINT